MKCQKCDKQATFHITEMIDAHPVELHLCQEHAYEYLHQNPVSPAVQAAENLELKEATDELLTDDFQTCPYCGASFQDFRKTGLLGCARDYVVFRDRLEPFLYGVNGSLEHVGKRPSRAKGSADLGATLLRLRNLLADAIEVEDYERASTLRDKIAELEKTAASPAK